MDNKQFFEVDIECQSCNGTGLYVGVCERDGCAVVCHTCNGSGMFHHKFKYKLFTGRKLCNKIERVFKNTCGYVHSAKDCTNQGRTIKFSEGGIKYAEWLAGGQPKPMKSLYCPKQWTNQQWSCEMHDYGSLITECKQYLDKSKCWDIYEAEQANKK